ncbi:phage tailspike protein [Escherichia albertii]|uniref:phage tailspike protein n=1 Tax=Escherichia albertii TaxID=208962 RepID=UPI0007445340|nr:phage tailspike protein [Escherichia albertii]MCZ8857088.1 phage tailspike protein [Escherichia albertii]
MTDITANVIVSMPSQLFTMARSFKAVANGKIYIGKIDTDPVNPENQIQVYVENEDGSHIPVSQPIIINAAGYPVYNGQIAKFVTVHGHSMAVYDAYGAQQFYFPNVLKYDPAALKHDLEAPYGMSMIGEFESVADLQSFSQLSLIDNGERVSVKSFHAGRGVGGGCFRWNATSTEAHDGFSVIMPSSVSGQGRWINVKKDALTPPECGAIPDDDTFDSATGLSRWATQNRCIGSPGVFRSSVGLLFTGVNPWVTADGMIVEYTAPEINGVMAPENDQTIFQLEGLEVKNVSATPSTAAETANGFRMVGLKQAFVRRCRSIGWKNAGIFFQSCRQWEAIDNLCWLNDWDLTSTFATGGDIVAYTGTPGASKGGKIIGNLLLSDASQGINVNALSADRDIIITNNTILTYNSDFTAKDSSLINKRHGIEFGYNSHQTYGGSILIAHNIIRDTNWTGIYRSGGADGSVSYPPSIIDANIIYNVGIKTDSSNISGGILIGDIVDGDVISNNIVSGFGQSGSGAYRIQDRVGNSKLTMINNVDFDSKGSGIYITGEANGVVVNGHRTVRAAGNSVFLSPVSGATVFGDHILNNIVVERATDGYGVVFASGAAATSTLNNLNAKGTLTDSTANSAVYVAGEPSNAIIIGGVIKGFAYGVWCQTYVDTTIQLPWGGITFIGTKNAFRLARTTGSANAFVNPNFYYGVTNRFSNGGAGSSNGAERLLVNGGVVA